LYATFTCIACSQLEKLRASLLDIRQTHGTAELDRRDETGQEEGHVYASDEVIRHMQKQLNDCIRHHQDILKLMLFLLLSSFDDIQSSAKILKVA
jgi:hypothetical protein